jgi:hypothetical protein
VQAIQQAQNDPVIQRMLTGAARAREIAAAEAIRNPAASQAALQQASAYEARARLMLEAARTAAEPTPAMKESAAAGMTPLQFERLADAANKYGPLDRNFENWMRRWQIDNPMFTQDEIRDPRRVAPPLARTPDDLRAMGWHEGEPFLTPNGRILTHMPRQ